VNIVPLLLIALLLGSCATSSVDADKQQKLARIHYELGMDALGKPGMLPKAFHELMKSDALLPDQPEVLDALAYAWLLRGDLKQSESYYRLAIRNGAGAATYNNYANMLNRAGRWREAEQAARKSLDDPSYPHQDLAFINLGDALLGQKQIDAAIRAYHQAQVFNPDSLLVSLRLARAYFKQQRLREARALYEILLRKQPANRAAAEGLLAVLDHQQDNAAAREMLDNFMQAATAPLDKAWAQDALERRQQP